MDENFFDLVGFDMQGTYDERRVDKYESDDNPLVISTAAVTDGKLPFETAVHHPLYNSNMWIIVDAYSTREEAQKGHDEWVKTMTAKTLPLTLTDGANSKIGQMLKDAGGDTIFERGVEK